MLNRNLQLVSFDAERKCAECSYCVDGEGRHDWHTPESFKVGYVVNLQGQQIEGVFCLNFWRDYHKMVNIVLAEQKLRGTIQSPN